MNILSTIRQYRNFVIGSIAATFIGTWALGGYEYLQLNYYTWRIEKLSKETKYLYKNGYFGEDGLAVPGPIINRHHEACVEMYIYYLDFYDFIIGKSSSDINYAKQTIETADEESLCIVRHQLIELAKYKSGRLKLD